MSNNKKDLIYELLNKHPEGLMLTQISNLLHISKITASIHIAELIGSGEVIVRHVGNANLHYLKKYYKRFGRS